jgi:Family of unknown function (DUF6491)
MKKTAMVTIALLATGVGCVMAGPREDAVAPAAPAAATSPAEVSIKFADHGGIWDWDVVDSKTVLIQDRSRRWYKATLSVNCVDLPFEQRIGFESNPDGSFDKFSTIQTRQHRCPLQSLVRTDAPVSKKGKKAGKPAPATSAPASDVKSVS